jgi:hypothetical protein
MISRTDFTELSKSIYNVIFLETLFKRINGDMKTEWTNGKTDRLMTNVTSTSGAPGRQKPLDLMDRHQEIGQQEYRRNQHHTVTTYRQIWNLLFILSSDGSTPPEHTVGRDTIINTVVTMCRLPVSSNDLENRKLSMFYFISKASLCSMFQGNHSWPAWTACLI